jgi:peroxiredoxin/mono/diheme cytochrome c family protein
MDTRHLTLLAALTLTGNVAAADDKPANDKINKKIDNFTLTDANGKKVALHDLKDNKAIVVVFLSFDCPVSTAYSPILAELAKTYGPKGVAFLGINSSDEMDAAKLAKTAAEYKLPFALLKDDKFVAADAFKAGRVPGAFVLDHNFVLRYRGRIDNGYAARLKPNRTTTSHDLRDALDDLLAGKDVRNPVTQVVGCTLRSRDKETVKTGKVTYHRDVLPILQEHCQQCHRPGEVGPFSLMTYTQAVNWASDIKEYTRDRKMPPWKPVESVPFHNDRRLSEKDIKTLAAWVDADTPEGDPKDAPRPKTFSDGWQLGKPDLVLTVPEDMTIGAAGKDLFRVFVLPTGLTEDKYVVAIEVRPGNTRVLHHTLNFFDTKGRGRELEKKEKDRAREKDEPDHGPGYSASMGVGFLPPGDGTFGGLSGWAPGQLGRVLPDGAGWSLPKGSDLLIQAHYHRTGRVERDRISIGLHFAKTPPKKLYKGTVLPGNGRYPYLLTIPKNDSNYKVTGTIWMKEDVTLYSVMPHMHMLGRKVKVTMTPPDGKPQTLIRIDDWEYNWQETYWLKTPLKVKSGTRFDVEAFYDNSDKNPNNPFNPPRTIRFGEETTNEMCFVFFGMTNDTSSRVKISFDEPKTTETKPEDKEK